MRRPDFIQIRTPVLTAAWISLLTAATPFHTVWAASGNSWMRQGAEAYSDGRLEEAAAAFTEALALTEEDESLDPAAAHLNLGTALARGGQYEPSAAALLEALKTDDLALQAKAQYNLGYVRYREADSLLEQQDLQNAKAKIDQSIDHFQDALRLAPTDLQTKKNFELSQFKKKQIEELIEQQPPQEQQNQSQDDENQEDEDQQDDNRDQDQDQGQDEDQQDQNQEQEQSQQDQNEEQNQQQDPQDPNQEQDESQQENPSSDQQDSEQESPPSQQPPPEKMTEEEARMLLEAMKEEEQSQREQYQIRLGRPQPVDKDW